MKNEVEKLISILEQLPFDEKVDAINEVRRKIHEISPFKNEPVDLVLWVKNKAVVANDYNPNKVAPPEMQLLEVSIMQDGYTQPIVTFPDEKSEIVEVVDGFHRSRVGKESIIVKERVFGYLPIVSIRSEKSAKTDRIASTIRHNRARGKHQVSAMSEIVIELKNRNWKNERIARELGMDEDEILRLCQVAGLEGLFKDSDFSKAWEPANYADENFEPISDDDIAEELFDEYRIPNESDSTRIFHTYDKWEHIAYNFFGKAHPTLSPAQCEYKCKEFLCNIPEFSEALEKIMEEWPCACEHNLTNKSMNRIAWLGQAAVAYKYNIPSISSAGFTLLTEKEQALANETALHFLNKWLVGHGMKEVSMNEAYLIDRQVELY